MKFECSKCSGRCKAEADFKPCKCLEDGSDSTYGWKEVQEPAPKPLPCVSKLTKIATQEDLSCKNEPLPKLTVAVFEREDCPEKKAFPDFIKVGNWVWCVDFNIFQQIKSISETCIYLASTEKRHLCSVPCNDVFSGFFQPARVRPWTFEEAPLEFKTKDDVFILLYIQDKQEWGYWAKKECEEYTLAEVAKEQIQIDGSPCGVLEVAENQP